MVGEKERGERPSERVHTGFAQTKRRGWRQVFQERQTLKKVIDEENKNPERLGGSVLAGTAHYLGHSKHEVYPTSSPRLMLRSFC